MNQDFYKKECELKVKILDKVPIEIKNFWRSQFGNYTLDRGIKGTRFFWVINKGKPLAKLYYHGFQDSVYRLGDDFFSEKEMLRLLKLRAFM